MKKHKEIKIVALMIARYCNAKHKTKNKKLCYSCAQVLEYAKQRTAQCIHKENKPFCANCQVQCYKTDMKQKMREIMRYSGPRIVFRHPIIAMRHLIESKKQKNNLKC